MSISYYGHKNVLKYCNRPYDNVDDMNHDIIRKHNKVVSEGDKVIHVGDFTLKNTGFAKDIIRQLNGSHTFIRGSHDKWMKNHKSVFHEMWERKIGNYYICAGHYAAYSWPRSHYNSYYLYGHHHGSLELPNKSMDIGVDTNNYYPYSLEEVVKVLDLKTSTPGLVKKVFGR